MPPDVSPLPPPASGTTPLRLPRVADVDLARAVEGAEWPPVSAATLPLRQNWLPQTEPAFLPGTVALAASEQALLVFADLTDESIQTTATADQEPLWERGDVFEIFLQSYGAELYLEFQIAPNGRRLHLLYPGLGFSRSAGLEPYIRRDRSIDFALKLDPANSRWRIAARIPMAPLVPARPRLNGQEWRMAFCRYDYDAAGQFCLSSTAPLTKPSFHRIGEWSRITIPGGFPDSTLAP
ncbi:MAG: carbohydrate-binding family 9-like protein [Verrucomicrobiota bacterium]